MFNWKKQTSASENIMTVAPEAHEMCLFTMKDKQMESFGIVFEAPNMEEVRNAFISAFRDVKKKDEPVIRMPQHFAIYSQGKVNKKTGKLTAPDFPILAFELEPLKPKEN